MCIVCGCGDPSAPPPTAGDEGARADAASGALHDGAGEARVSVPGMSRERSVRLEADVLGANNRIAASNRSHFAAHGVTALNLVSGPGAGKTTLLVGTVEALRKRHPEVALAVIVGDQQTSRDADRIRAAGVSAVQVNTGRGCHLDARMVADAFDRLPLHGHRHGGGHEHTASATPRLLLIENVGNLICPALWDLGEAAKVAILSVTDGEDKPLKYPDMLAAARLMVLNKVDLLPYVSFDVGRCIEYARRVNPDIRILQLSATRGDGVDAWVEWLAGMLRPQSAAQMHRSAAGPAARLHAAGTKP
ncbi:MAG: hydrogenase nickel incorporation protein HypB [Burkholderiales bacterium]|nr:MAG: hydrogenase nickel incorporation protein HypB [Burkholderiales bacterium]